MARKRLKASVLVASVVITGLILASAIAISLASVRERAISMGGSRSNAAFQNAETGVESVMSNLTKNSSASLSSISSLDGDASCRVDSATGHAYYTSGEYKIEFKKQDDTESTNCDTLASDISVVKSIGNDTQGQTTRAIEAAVAVGVDIKFNEEEAGSAPSCSCTAECAEGYTKFVKSACSAQPVGIEDIDGDALADQDILQLFYDDAPVSTCSHAFVNNGACSISAEQNYCLANGYDRICRCVSVCAK